MIGTAIQIIAYLGKFASDNTKKFECKEKKERRSLQANAYYWLLCSKVAKKTGIPAARIHNENLRCLSVPERVNGALMTVSLPDTDEVENKVLESSTYHLMPTSKTFIGKHNVRYRAYVMLRGSHTFCTEDMSALIDLMVQEAEAQDIETITPAEKQKMMELYGRSYEKKHNTTA